MTEMRDQKASFLADVTSGLSATPRSLPSKYFYDARGSQLFEDICALPEYYPTRTEIAILEDAAPMVADLVGPKPLILEFGSGASVKVRALLDALDAPAGYVAVDISEAALSAALASLSRDYPDLPAQAVHADYTKPFSIPPGAADHAGAVLGFFPGSTIGNFTRAEALSFLSAARTDVGDKGWMLLGVDLLKDTAVLEAAYDDAAGVTAAFNKNVLERINRELDGDFDVAGFEHRAFFNANDSRIEMHLEAARPQTATIGGQSFTFATGERIHTENSHKYPPRQIKAMARAAGFSLNKIFLDDQAYFGVFLLRAD